MMRDPIKKQKNKKILVILIFVTLAFIFGNSIVDREHSSQESGWVLALMQPMLELFVGKGNVTEHLVRKLAHFTEFSLLGVELCLFFHLRADSVQKAFLLAFTHGMFTALSDETIQIFSHRGPQISDVWLDTSGAAFGACAVLILLWIISRYSAQKNRGQI